MQVDYRLPTSKEGIKHIMDILMNKLYVNPHTACVREILSNAVDANRVAGTRGIEIWSKIHNEQLKIRIKDRGLGMSPETIQTVFTEFGVSTKRNDSATIGAFGIGATSIFAVGGGTIRTRHDGTLSTYRAFLQDDLPVIQLEEQKPSNESGTEVEFLINQTPEWDTLLADIPDVKLNGRRRSDVVSFSDNGWELRSTGQDLPIFIEKILISVKGACYVGDITLLPKTLYDNYYRNPNPFKEKTFCRGILLIRCDDIELSASRESINMEAAKPTIVKRLKEVEKFFFDSVEAHLATAKSMAEARLVDCWFPFLNTDNCLFQEKWFQKVPRTVTVSTSKFSLIDARLHKEKTERGQRNVEIPLCRLLEMPVLSTTWNVTQVSKYVEEPCFFGTGLHLLVDTLPHPEVKLEPSKRTWRGRVKVFKKGNNDWERAKEIKPGFYVEGSFSGVKKLFTVLEVDELYWTSSEVVSEFDLPLRAFKSGLNDYYEKALKKYGPLGIGFILNHSELEEISKEREELQALRHCLLLVGHDRFAELTNAPWDAVPYYRYRDINARTEGEFLEKYLGANPQLLQWLELSFPSTPWDECSEKSLVSTKKSSESWAGPALELTP